MSSSPLANVSLHLPTVQLLCPNSWTTAGTRTEHSDPGSAKWTRQYLHLYACIVSPMNSSSPSLLYTESWSTNRTTTSKSTVIYSTQKNYKQMRNWLFILLLASAIFFISFRKNEQNNFRDRNLIGYEMEFSFWASIFVVHFCKKERFINFVPLF